MATPRWLNFVWDACWRERGLFGRVLQVVVVTIPAGMAIFIQGWSREQWPLWVWGALVLGGLPLALTVGVFRQAYQLWLNRQPKVSIEPSIHTEPKGIEGHAKARTIRLQVQNESTLHLRNCSLREYRFVNRSGHESGMQRHFRLAEECHADMAKHTFKRTFDLRGKGARQLVEIALLDETKPDSNVLMLYATEPTAQTLNSIPRQFFHHELEVMFSADDIAIPEKKTFVLSVSKDGFLRITPKEP
jgi:hypothetical protein